MLLEFEKYRQVENAWFIGFTTTSNKCTVPPLRLCVLLKTGEILKYEGGHGQEQMLINEASEQLNKEYDN
jgi:hypothetical protein